VNSAGNHVLRNALLNSDWWFSTEPATRRVIMH
jgi:hypothetical protein